MSSRVKTPYFKWRSGRPRWEPGPGLRARGFAGRDLKDAAGNWLPQGAARDAADKLNAATRGDTVATLTPDKAARNVANLVALFKASPNFRDLAPKTQIGYRSHIGLVEDWAGDMLVSSITKANIANWILMLRETRGAAMANATLRVVKILLYYAMDDLEWIDRVRARKVKMGKTTGRLVIWPMAEVLGYVAWADWAGRPDLGDAVILGCLAGQRRADLLALPRGKLSDGIYRFKTAKTGADVKVPAVRQLAERITAARARADERWPNVKHLTELVDVTTGTAFDAGGKKFHKDFRSLLLLAAGEHDGLTGAFRSLALVPRRGSNLLAFYPALKDLLFMDLRDTAVTWLALAGCDKYEISTITGHSLATIDAIMEKHYLVKADAFAHSGGAKLEAFLDKANFG